MIPVTQFVDKVRPQLCGCPDIRIKTEVMNVLHDFCSMTQAWQEWLPDITVTQDDEEILIPQPTGKHILYIVAVKCNGKLREFGIDDSAVTLTDAGVLAGVDVRCDGVMQVKASFTVLPDSTEVPDMFWLRYRDVIASGVLANLYGQLRKPWGNSDLYMVNARQYSDGIATVRGDIVHGFSAAPMKAPTNRLVGAP